MKKDKQKRGVVPINNIGQNSKGPLVEVTTKLHSSENKKAFKILHNQFNANKHPEFPVDHGGKCQSDVR